MAHPYTNKPDYQFWKRAGGIDSLSTLDPVTKCSFRISRNEPVITAGSCFAQHVAKRLSENGFNYFVCEKAHSLIPDSVALANNYGVFSARYGNLYTARQLKQLLQRAWGNHVPIENTWQLANGNFVDPFRPQVQPGGFISEAELNIDREQHFAAIRRGIKKMSVFVFTLGLTEAWADKRDGSVFPLAPGVAGGTYNPDIHEFVNFDLNDTLNDLRWSIKYLRRRNPNCKIIITVSPVPLNATAVDRHVLVSTVYSKSVLRIAAEDVCNTFEFCDYFPSYEIITAPHAGGVYFASDKRSVTEAGVDHVMGLFLKHYGDTDGATHQPESDDGREAVENHRTAMENVVRVLCDEEAIDNT
ncbi:hypothetical protein MMA231_03469 (plasmid) [Asticcacaulis sp. MM231]|uniref:GSCFA domain-containing protein n=1 Tax=Asticcacaulis sp. MM231 TaxID=3157666 RepID=UPI0032D58658